MGRPARIDRAKVVAAAIRVLDAEGLGGLSLERLADELDVKAPTLYYHYADKSAILDAVAKSVLGNLGIEPDPADWRQLLVDFCVAFYRRVVEHPNVVVLLIEHLPASGVLRAFDDNAAILESAGIPPHARAAILEGTQHFLWGMALYQAVGQVNPAFAGVVDRQRYPHWAGALAAKPVDSERFLEIGVRALIDGLMEHLDDLDSVAEIEHRSDVV
jgi:TetR/AcrR family transcriptional regulator, tetracycline repressor protein